MSLSEGNSSLPKVYFIRSPITAEKVSLMLDCLSFQFLKSRALVGIKIHWGEDKNTTYVPPEFIRPIVDKIKQSGALPFLTDSLTLYSGRRRDGVSALTLAYEHGFNFPDAPVIIADGLRGENKFVHKVNSKHFREFELCGILLEADGFVVVSHFKGHLESGFGGAIKNIGMGFASRRMKQLMHADVKPVLKEGRCNGCGRCVKICPNGAISLVGDLAHFYYELCIGCASCIAVCPFDALKFHWEHNPVDFLERLVEGAFAAYQFLRGRSVFLNFLVNITPECDCMPYEQEIMVEDIGLLGSLDPVAIDALSIELFNSARPKGSFSKKTAIAEAKDKLAALYPEIPYRHKLIYAESIGLGKSSFVRVDL